ncbi:MAG: helix-turn-helix domain-containing protein [Methylohalobius sp.]|nr:helix-turn-helix domain-containing protein [Methylohalobius sp.]
MPQRLKTLADRIQYGLAINHLSQSELARRVGLTPQAIQHLCSGKAQTTRYAAQIAHALGVRTDWLLTGQGPITSPTPPSPQSSLEKLINTLHSAALSQEDIQLLTHLAQRLAKNPKSDR